eukprot:COSAG01_NODE_7594_length_3134_cov_5.924547_2_plen_41_part_00
MTWRDRLVYAQDKKKAKKKSKKKKAKKSKKKKAKRDPSEL